MLIFHRRHLEAVLAEYIEHYNQHRPHRSLERTAPLSISPPPAACPDAGQLRRAERLGGLLHEYELAV
jgi:putative transposase